MRNRTDLQRFPLIVMQATACLILLATSVQAESLPRFCNYLYISNSEITPQGDTLGWTPHPEYVNETRFIGPFHFNSVFRADSVTFLLPVTCAQPSFAVGGEFVSGLTFDADSVYFPDSLQYLREIASEQGQYYSNNSGAWQSRLTSRTGSFFLEQWSSDLPYDPANMLNRTIVMYGSNTCVFVEGRLEIQGCDEDDGHGVFNGQTTLASSGDIYLLDNIMHAPFTVNNFPQVVPEEHCNRLGIVAQNDIIIADTWANGRGNGLYRANGNHDSSHVIIMAALMAANGSFTFEHQNNPEDDYIWCDPDGPHADERDERGNIYLRGSLAQRQRGYWHTSNCNGTGYKMDAQYDQRLAWAPPPGFPRTDGLRPERSYFNHLEDTTVVITEPITVADELVLGPGAHIIANFTDLLSGNLFSPFSELYINGTPENPVIIEVESAGQTVSMMPNMVFDCNTREYTYGPFRFLRADSTWTGLNIIADNFILDLPYVLEHADIQAGNLTLNAITDEGNWSLQGNSVIRDSRLAVQDSIVCKYGTTRFELMKRTLVEGKLTNRFRQLDRCTFVNNDAEGTAVTNYGEEQAEILNSFFYGFEDTLVSGTASVIDYSGYFPDTEHPFGANIETGNTIFSNIDPLFVDPDAGDFHLQEGSPLIDAGNPATELDSDGTVADIGAFYYDQLHTPDNEESNSELPTSHLVAELYPNPFNQVTTVSVELPRAGDVEISVFAITGQRVMEPVRRSLERGRHQLMLPMNRMASGVYIVRVQAGEERVLRKAILVK